MIKIRHIVMVILTISFLTGCDFVNDTNKYKDSAKEFIQAILKEDYEKCITLMAMDHPLAKDVNIDTMKMGLSNFRKVIVDNWGTELEYSFVKSQKKFSTIKKDNTPPNTTIVFIEFNNHKNIGLIEFLFDDNSKKILNLTPRDSKAPVPDMTFFWLFGLIAICIPIFNIYVIRQIKRSDLDKKWLKYFAIIFLNVPAINYAAIGGLTFKLLNFQILLGISFGYMGYLNTYWTFGIPLGGIYWLWKLKQKKALLTDVGTITDKNSESTVDIDRPKTE